MKKHFALLSLLLTFACFENARAEGAIGAVIGDPTGISGRIAVDGKHSIEGALAYSTGTYDGLHIHGTYLWDGARSFATTEGPIEMFYGLGARLISVNKGEQKDKVAFGPRAPIGLLYNFTNPDIEVFGELSLALDLTPKVGVDLDVGVGARIRF